MRFLLFGANRNVPDDEYPLSGPGNTTLLAGNNDAGWFGEVPAASLITPAALSTAVGMTYGTAINSSYGWLKFVYGGKILFIAKRPIRYNLSWNNINALNLVYGAKTIVIGGRTYKVRLILGGNADPASNNGREWDRLIYPVTSERGGAWANYSSSDLVYGSGDGRYSWCQEKISGNTSNALCRGGASLTSFGSGNPASSANANYGWRPVLELVE